jgi:hypothetical protein
MQHSPKQKEKRKHYFSYKPSGRQNFCAGQDQAKGDRARKMPHFSPHVNAFFVTDWALPAD